jgi:hypothetical protein
LGVTGEVDFNALRQQPFAAPLTTTGEDAPPAFGFHACAKSELLLARALGWLVGAFHCLLKLMGRREFRETPWKSIANAKIWELLP